MGEPSPDDDRSISSTSPRKEVLASLESFLQESFRISESREKSNWSFHESESSSSLFVSRAKSSKSLHHESSGYLSEPSSAMAKSIPERVLENRLGVFLAGQGVSLTFSTVSAAQATLYFSCGLSAPAFSLTFVYLFLWIGLWIPLIMEGRKTKILMQQTNARDVEERYWFLGIIPTHLVGWHYLGIAIISVEANYFNAKALRFTTITSATIFDAVGLPSAMILSKIFLKRQYRILHLVGAVVCVGGIALNMVVDFVADEEASADAATVQVKDDADSTFDDGSDEYPERTIGNALALIGGILYGACDVLTENCVRHYGGVTEFLGMVGFWGFWICLIQASILERQAIADFFEPSDNGECTLESSTILLVVYVCSQLIRKISLASFLTISEAALLNMSLLTSDLYSAIFSIVAQRILPRPLFWVSMSSVLSGIVVYESGGSPLGGSKHPRGGEGRTEDDPKFRNIAPASSSLSEDNLRLRAPGAAAVTRV